MTVHMSVNALNQIKSKISFLENPQAKERCLFLCGICFETGDQQYQFIGNSDIGSDGQILYTSKHKKITCPECIKVLRENGL